MVNSCARAGEDTKILLARQRALQPRTYRVAAGYSLWLGGLVCIDTVQLPAKTIYLTVWASDLLPLHLGKSEKAVALYEQFKGTKLYPPVAQPSEDAPKTAPGVHEALGELQPLNVRPAGARELRSAFRVCSRECQDSANLC